MNNKSILEMYFLILKNKNFIFSFYNRIEWDLYKNEEPTEGNQPTTAGIEVISISSYEPVEIQDATPKWKPIKKKETLEHVESGSVPQAKPKRRPPQKTQHMEVVVATTEYLMN